MMLHQMTQSLSLTKQCVVGDETAKTTGKVAELHHNARCYQLKVSEMTESVTKMQNFLYHENGN